MWIKRFVILLGLVTLFTGCSADQISMDNFTMASAGSSTDRGVRYLLGRGVPQNSEKAFYYFHQAANNDDPFAENEVAYMYATGEGTTQNYGEAFKWYQRAANHDLASAQYNLGLFYLYGLGTESNKALAIKWFQKSANHGFEPARVALARYQS